MDQSDLSRMIGWLATITDDLRAVRARLTDARDARSGSPAVNRALEAVLVSLERFDDRRGDLSRELRALHEAAFPYELFDRSSTPRAFPDWHPKLVPEDRTPTAGEIEGDWRTSLHPESVHQERQMLARLRRDLVASGAAVARTMTDAELSARLRAADRRRREKGGEAFATDPEGDTWREFIDAFAEDLARDEPTPPSDRAS